MLIDFDAAPTRSSDRMIQSVPSLRWSATQGATARAEEIIIEAALCLELSYLRAAIPVVKSLGITMRTPGCDEELALGFLFGEGLIASAADVRSTEATSLNNAGETIDTRRVILVRPPTKDLGRVARANPTTSACGLCGRTSLTGLPVAPSRGGPRDFPPVSSKLINQLPEALRAHQVAFARTGGSHAAALVGRDGAIILSREDVGRHNAVDKLFGAALVKELEFSKLMLVLSGRVSFELVQKSASAGVPLIVAVGAPSTAAIELAHAAEITLIGFTRENRFNLYTHATRVALR